MARKAVAKTPLGQRLTEVREALGYSQRKPFADLLGINPETLGGYERGDSLPDLDFLVSYKKRFSVYLDWLVAGEGPVSPYEDIRVQDPAIGSDAFRARVSDRLTADVGDSKREMSKGSDFVNLRQYDVHASAGGGLIAIDQLPVSEMAFERNFLRSLGGAPDYCFMMWATGNSMMPTIPDNALLIVDSNQRVVDHGRIYVFAVGNAVLVKRARWRMDGKLDLTSDNIDAGYPVETFSADRVEDLTVVGRVIFVGQQS